MPYTCFFVVQWLVAKTWGEVYKARRERGVAQPGRALRSGRRGRRFESSLPDQAVQGLR